LPYIGRLPSIEKAIGAMGAPRKAGMKINRRSSIATLIACALAFSANATEEAPGKQWQFDVALDGKPIGFHTFELQHEGSTQILTTEASFDVKFLFVTAFRYRHQNTETWSNGCLSSIDASTDSNGQQFDVRGEIGNGSFEVLGAEGSMTLPRCVQTFAYWNPAILESQKLLNSQTGEYEDVTVALEGREQLTVAGQQIDTLRYRLSAEAGDITLWYSSADTTWVGLEAPAKGGRKLRYQAVVVPDRDTSRQLVARSD
jgi:hypothetical protein